MKKLIAGLLLVIPFVSYADPYIGCGLGSHLWEGQSGIAPRVLGATTNGLLGNQTFGITFGTLGCKSDTPITLASQFINFNMNKLAQDSARGEGETLAALSEILGVADADKLAFNSLIQANFSSIYATDTASGDEVLANLLKLMQADPALNKYVS